MAQATRRIPITALSALAFLTLPFMAQAANFYASPGGVDNPACSQAQPCTAQGAVAQCHTLAITLACEVAFADGVYLNPAINIYYHKVIALRGNCSAPQNIVFRGTQPGPLIQVQDYAIGSISCVTLDATTNGVAGIAGRQHIIIDYYKVIFGSMPQGLHITLNEFSIASCSVTAWITGDAVIHASASNSSKINLGCNMELTGPRNFIYFTSAAAFSIIDAGLATFSGFGATGTGCNLSNSLAYKPAQPFPGSQQGNC